MRRVAIAGVGITPRNRAYLSQADRKSWKEYVADAAYDAIANVKKAGIPVVVLLISGRPMIIENVLPQADAFMSTGNPNS